MKENVKISKKIEGYSPREISIAVAYHLLSALACAVAARGIVLKEYIPFGIAFLGGASPTYLPSAALGCFISYFLSATGSSAFRYIAALFAVVSVKLLLATFKSLSGNALFLSLISMLSLMLTGFATVNNGGLSVFGVITESLLCGMVTFFVKKIFTALEKPGTALSTDELTALLITSAVVLMGFFGFEMASVSLGRILSFFLILICAKYGGIVSGAIAGTTIGFAVALSQSGGVSGMAFAIAGLMAGVFSRLGKYAMITVLAIFTFIGAVSTGNAERTVALFFEVAFAGAFFFLLPRGMSVFLCKIFSAHPRFVCSDGIKKSLTMRLELASNALKDVSQTVEQVSSQLSKINSPDYEDVITAVERDGCAGCKLRVHCWETKRSQTIDAVLEMTKAIKNGNTSPETAAPEEFRGRCTRATDMGNVAFRKYSEYASRVAAENRIDEVRSVVSDQFNGISDMLFDLSEDFKNDENFDNTTAENAAAALKNLNIRVDEASCRMDKFGRMTLEFKIKNTEDLVINRLQIMKLISVSCERDFDAPNISKVGKDIFIVINEKAALSVDIGLEQIVADGSAMCGDCAKYFFDGRGRFFMVLSDGMGTGGRAAVDGAMACGLMTRLIKAGFGFDCSLRFLNSSMLFKSTDESLATVDIACIDLFTGQTSLYKAGAAPTVVRRSGRTGKAESSSLPAGILRDIGFDKAVIRCRAGDVVVLMSDGAAEEGTDWIRAEVEAWGNQSAQALAEHLCIGAKRRHTGPHEDDITVMAAVLSNSD